MIFIGNAIIYKCKKTGAPARREYGIVLNSELGRYYSMIFDGTKYHWVCIQYYWLRAFLNILQGAAAPPVTAEIYVRFIAVHVKKTVIHAYLFIERIKWCTIKKNLFCLLHTRKYDKSKIKLLPLQRKAVLWLMF